MPTARVNWRHLDRHELDKQLSPSRSAKDFLRVLQRHEAETAALQGDRDLVVIRNIAHGSGNRAKLDLVYPIGQGPWPCVVMIHGGFWQEGSKEGSGFAARSFTRQGWSTALLSYTLAPDASLRQILAEIAGAIQLLHDQAAEFNLQPARIVVVGHSAGGHLGAALLAGIVGPAFSDMVAGYVLISGVYDLAPIAASYVNDLVRITEAEVDALSPILYEPRRDAPVHLLIGADEPDMFQQQSDLLHEAWSRSLSSLTFRRVPERDHFDILDELALESTETRTILAGMLG